MKSVFAEGKQPCDNFSPTRDQFGINVHECMWPFEGDGPRCSESHHGRVSFCQNCNRDHHSGGYETCASQIGSAPDSSKAKLADDRAGAPAQK